MRDMCDKIKFFSSSSSALSVPQPVSSATDEMSLFLQQILVRSSSSSLPSSLTGMFGSGDFPAAGDEILTVDSSLIGRDFVSPSSVGPSENDNNDEYDCESEEGLEALGEELPETEKSANRRGSNKRSRAAEVHNLSEKRRRSRINEKMKALQNLIPNSNKTDKASMLDEAIEYLKQLQLQVQMLAMRNGLSLYPVSVPGGLHHTQLTQMRMDFSEENRSLQSNPPFHSQTMPTQNLFSAPDKQFVSNILNSVNSETSIRLATPMHPQLAAFQQPSSAQDRMIKQQTNVNNPEASHLEFGVEATATLASLNRQPSTVKGNSFLETWSENMLPKSIEQGLIIPFHSSSMRTQRRSASRDNIEID